MTATQAFEHVSAAPAPALRPHIREYLGYRMAGFEPGIHVGLPSRSLTFIVSIDDPIDLVGMPDPGQSPAALHGAIGGLAAGPAFIRHDGNQHGVSLDVTPLGARALFGLPAAALAWAVVTPEDALGPPGAELVERLNLATTWTARFAILDEVLLRVLVEPPPVAAEVRHAWHLLCASHGSVRVEEVAREVGWSRRHLAERFRAEFGVSPKLAARISRFERARGMLTDRRRPSLADVAAVCGYSDQAHLTREWKAFTGASPLTWLADEQLPFVQDDEGAPGAP